MSNYIKSIKATALAVSTPAEAQQLVDYVRVTWRYDAALAFKEGVNQAQYMALSACLSYWANNAKTSDALEPAIAIVNALSIIDTGTDMEHAQLTILRTISGNMVPYNEPDCTYEEFCDKFSHLLNA